MKYDQGWSYRLGIMLVAVGVSTVFLTGCVNKAQQNFERPPSPVQVAVCVSQDVPTYLDAIGKTVAREVVSIQPQVSGRIIKIHFTDGANVRKGDLLFTIDTRPFEANLRQAQANLSKDGALKKQAEANLVKEIAAAKWGLVQVERYRTLVEQGVVPREQYEQYRANYDSLKANVEAARATVGFITLYITPVIYLYLEQFQENVLDRTSFFRSRRSQKARGGDSPGAPESLPSAVGD